MTKTAENKLQLEETLTEDKQNLLQKLSSIFDPQTAIDFVCPKTLETRQTITIDDLKVANYEQPEVRLQRLRTMDHYQTTTQSLARADLEASYQAFVRGQVGQQQFTREELEQFVRNSSDIDAAKRFFESSNDLPPNSLQSHLLFHSSKLNEQRANVLKSAGPLRSLQQMNEDLSLQKYFSETLTGQDQRSSKQKHVLETKPISSRPHTVHVEHKEKKYRIKFLKDNDELDFLYKPLHRSTNNRHLFVLDQKNIESLLDGDNASADNVHSRSSNTANIHREIFPPLSLAALREYRPTLTAKSTGIPSQKQPKYVKQDFIWEQSIVLPKT